MPVFLFTIGGRLGGGDINPLPDAERPSAGLCTAVLCPTSTSVDEEAIGAVAGAFADTAAGGGAGTAADAGKRSKSSAKAERPSDCAGRHVSVQMEDCRHEYILLPEPVG